MEILSPSKINTFEGCPFKFKCYYIDHQPKIKTEDTYSFGSMVHDIIPMYYDKVTELSQESDIKQKIEEAFAEGTDWRLQKRKKSLEKCQKEFQKFEINRLRSHRGLPTFTERKIKAKLFDDIPEIEGIVDGYWQDQGGMWVDWKTGKWAEMTPSLCVQGKVYEMLLKANGFPVKKGKFVNLYRGIILDLPNLTDAWLHQKLRDMMEKLGKSKFPILKSPLCNGYCEYRLRCDLRDMGEGFYELF